MEHLPAQGTWERCCFREYAEHSAEHDDIPDSEEETDDGPRMRRVRLAYPRAQVSGSQEGNVIMSKPKVKNPADMSKPPEERGRRRQSGPVGGTPPAQLSHAAGSRGSRWSRDGERKFEVTMPRHLRVREKNQPDGPAGDDT